jgi:hypothetical protein
MNQDFPQRFDMDCKTVEEAMHYFKNRALQLLFGGFQWTQEKTVLTDQGKTWGVKTSFIQKTTAKKFQAVYVLDSARGKGLASGYFKKLEDPEPVITVKNCDIEEFLTKNNIPYVIGNTFIESPEYQLVSRFYGNSKANRSQVFKMNHIDEGLYILAQIGAPVSAMKAYCLHPLLQENNDLALNYGADFQFVDPLSLILTMEYRWVANLYLSYRTIQSLDEVKLSPLKEVQQMLIADKVQNYKDFLTHHFESHDRRSALTQYFINWLSKLEVSVEQYNALVKELIAIDQSRY